MSVALHPLELAALERLKTWLPKLSYPIRIGEHTQTAFSSAWLSTTRALLVTPPSPIFWSLSLASFI